jgi:hypothetical protein
MSRQLTTFWRTRNLLDHLIEFPRVGTGVVLGLPRFAASAG